MAFGFPGASAAQEAPAASEDSEIVVSIDRERGKVAGDIPPEVSLNPQDIRAIGASSIAELLTELGPQVRSGRGRGNDGPVVLINGKRVSGFAEIRNIPPEALLRVDILPEEVALKYGYRADQRVVNFVLRERFRAVTGELELGGPTDGGRTSVEADANFLRIRKGTRLSLEGEYNYDSLLLESERDVIQAPAPVDTAPFRSLLPETRALTLGAAYAASIGDVAATVTGGFESTASEAFVGLPAVGAVPMALIRATDSWTGRLGTALNGAGTGWAKGWNWSLVGNYSHGENETVTDRGLDLTGAVLRERAASNNDRADVSFVFNGSLVAVPAGSISASFKAGGQALSQGSESIRGGAFQRVDLSRTQGNFQGSFDVPLTSVRNDVLAGVGDLSANFNVAVDTLSDFGTLTTYGFGAAWKPVDGVELIASQTNEEGAPSIGQLGDPLLATPNVRVFDFLRGETVDITRLDGGNRGLVADVRKVRKVGLTIKPFAADLTVTANFIDSQTDDVIAGFPTATAELEAAFPERFRRDINGILTIIDNRPVNFEASDRQEMRWGFNFSQALPASKAQLAVAAARRAEFEARRAAGGVPGGAPPGGRPGGFGGPGGGGGGGFRGLDGRFQLSVFHTWRFKEEILIREGVPVLDLLNGSATGSRGGQPRHLVEVRAGVGKSGLGARLGVNWQSGTSVLTDPSGATTAPDDLFFSGLATVNLRLFADLGQRPDMVRRAVWLRGARISVSVDNIANSKIGVRDRTGATPLGYQPDLIDPLGRTVTVSFRKVFF